MTAPAAAYDEETYAVLLNYLPLAVRGRAAEGVAAARSLFENERHYEVISAVEEVMALCKGAAESAVDCPITVAVGGRDAASPVSSPTTQAAAPQPTYLSTMVFCRFLAASRMYTTALRRAEDCNELLRDIENTAGWTEVNVDAAGCGTFYRLDKPTGRHCFKVVSDTTVNPIYLCGTIMELDLYSEWFPMCTCSRNQGDVSRFHKSSFFVVKAPWPFADREVFIEGYGIDDLEINNRVVIVAHSLYEDKETPTPPIRVPESKSGNVRADLLYGGFLIQIQSATTTRVSFIMSIDPKVPNIPQRALNWVSGMVLWQMMMGIQKASTKGMDRRSKYWQRRRERPDVYELFRVRFNDVLRKKATPEEYERMRLPPDY